jgi:hypothetical protein
MDKQSYEFMWNFSASSVSSHCGKTFKTEHVMKVVSVVNLGSSPVSIIFVEK